MARKSRRRVAADNPSFGCGTRAEVYRVGAYTRLSAVDRKQKGDSIANQQAIITAYCNSSPGLELREVYIDNGLRGRSLSAQHFRKC